MQYFHVLQTAVLSKSSFYVASVLGLRIYCQGVYKEM